MGIGNLGGFDDLFHGSAVHTKSDVVVEGVVKQDSLLVDVTYQLAKLRDADTLDILTVNQHLAVLDIMITGNEVYKRRLTRSRLTNKGDGFSFGNLQINMLQHLTSLNIAERHVTQLYLLFKRRHGLWMLRLLDGVISFQDEVDTVHGSQSEGYLVSGSREFFQRIDDAIEYHHIEDERGGVNKVRLMQNEESAEPQHHDDNDGTKEL